MVFDGDGDGIFGESGDNFKALVNGTLTIPARDTTTGTPTITATDYLGQTGANNYTIYQPTAVMLSSFSGEAYQITVRLDWATANELYLLGFNIYRSESVAGVKEKRNPSPIEAKMSGRIQGAAYQFFDDVEPGKRYYYWLQLVPTSGNEFFEMPVELNTDYMFFIPFVNR